MRITFFTKLMSSLEFTAPSVPESGSYIFPEEPQSFGDGILEIMADAAGLLRPAIAEAAGACLCLIAIVLLISLVNTVPGSTAKTVELVSAISIAVLLLRPSSILVQLGIDTVRQLSEYGKLLLPVMTAASAAQGAATSSAALYTGTAVFDAVLCALISSFIVPMVYVFLALAVANSAVGDDILKRLRDFVKWLMTWCLKAILYIFTGYMGITGVVTGAADAAAVKAAKITISGMVPVVGNILSDASETILVSAGVMKSAAGVYGLLALISVFIGPFLKIGAQYLLLKLTAAVCNVFGAQQAVGLIQDFSSAMGLILAMTGTVCLLLLISTVCFMKGVG